MKFYVNIVVHQSDSTQPNYQSLHRELMDAGFLQRGLDGTLNLEPTSGLYCREDSVLNRSEIEFDLRTVLQSFPHRCSYELEQRQAQAPNPATAKLQDGFAEAVRMAQLPGALIQ